MICFTAGTRKEELIQQGKYSSLITHQNQLYAAECNKNEVHVFAKNRRNAWAKTRTIKLRYETNNGLLKICERGDRLVCSSTEHCEIQEYTFTGKFLQAYFKCGYAKARQLRSPRICFADKEGSVLIADCDNNKLQVMNEYGEFRALNLHPKVLRPLCATIFKGHLYVASADKTMHKYSW